MIHPYKLGGYNIVLDVCSGSVHVVDEAAYDVITLFEDHDRETVLEAASLAVTYSQARDGGKAAVDYTQVRNVKKPAGARPGRVIYTDYATVIAQGDETLARRLSRE